MLESAIARARRSRPRRRRPLPGPRQLQARERLARPPRRRPAADPAGGAPPRLHPRDRPGRAPGRRRVPAAAGRPRAGAGGVGRRAGRRAARSPSPWPRACARRWSSRSTWTAASSSSSASIGISLFPQDAQRRRVAPAATPTRRCTGRRSTSPAGTSSSRRATTIPLQRLSLTTRLRQAVARPELGPALPADRRPRERDRGLGGGARPLAAAERRPGAARASSSRSPRRSG